MSLQVERRLPPPALAADVQLICGYDERTDGPMRRREVPHGGVVLIFDLGPELAVREAAAAVPTRHPGGFVAGVMLRPVFCDTEGAQSGVEVLLTATGAGRLLGMPVAALGQRVVALRDIEPRGLGAMAARLAELPTWPARLDAVEDWLHRRAAQARALDPALAEAWRLTRRRPRIGEVARALDWSPRHLARRFGAEFGLAPSTARRLARFEAAVAALRGPASQAEIAAACGYADQAHMAREVVAFAGLTPGALRRAALPGEGGIAG